MNLGSIKLLSKITLASCGFFSPFQLNFAITYHCNSKCKTCGIWKLKSKNELSLQEIKKIAKKLSFIHWLRLTGGEPFLRKDYVKIVKTFHKNLDLYLLTTPTNSLCSTSFDQIEKVLDFFDRKYIITISLDGPEKIHDKIRGVNGNWQKAVSLFNELKELEKIHENFKVFFGYTISPYNFGFFKQTLKNVKNYCQITANDFHFNICQTSHYLNNSELKLGENFSKNAIKEIDTILSLKRNFTNLIDIIEKRYLYLGQKYLQNKKSPIDCKIFNLSCFINPFGNVFPCTSLDIKLGNLRNFNYDLKKILISNKIVNVKGIIAKKLCYCWTPCEAHQMILTSWLK